MSRIIQALYISTPTFKLTEDTIGDQMVPILNTACTRNPTKDITGALAFTRNHFIQVLEGPPVNVTGLLAKIEADPRHDRMALCYVKRSTERLFSVWAMAFVPPETLDRYRYVRRSQLGDIEPHQMPPPDLVRFIYDIVASREYVLDQPLDETA